MRTTGIMLADVYFVDQPNCKKVGTTSIMSRDQQRTLSKIESVANEAIGRIFSDKLFWPTERKKGFCRPPKPLVIR